MEDFDRWAALGFDAAGLPAVGPSVRVCVG